MSDAARALAAGYTSLGHYDCKVQRRRFHLGHVAKGKKTAYDIQSQEEDGKADESPLNSPIKDQQGMLVDDA
ncbi:hypothetical protein JCM10296v2_002982 [Rhodotorula toruloides]